MSLSVRIAKKRIVYLLIAGVISLNVVVDGIIGFSIYETKLDYVGRTTVSAQNISQILNENISGSFAKIDIAIQAVADEAEHQLATGEMHNSWLNSTIIKEHARLPELNILVATNTSGDVIYGSKAKSVKTISISHRDYFKFLRDTPNAGMVISKPVIGAISGKRVLVLARRINMPDGSFAGVISAGIDINYLTNIFSEIIIGRHGSILLVDSDMSIVAQYPKSKSTGDVARHKIELLQFHEMIRSGKTDGIFGANIGNYPAGQIISFNKLTLSNPLYVFVGLASSDYLSDWRSEVSQKSLFMVIFFLITALSTWLFYRQWSRRIEVEHAIFNGEERHRSIIQSAKDGFWMVNTQGRLMEVNESYCQMSGYSRQELLKLSIADLDANETTTDAVAHNMKIKAQGEDNFLAQHRRKDGTVYFVEVSCKCLSDEEGLFVCFVRDITERKEAEEAVFLSKQQLWSYFESAGDAIYIIDVDAGRFLNCNSRACLELGYSKDELVDLSPAEIECKLTHDEIAAINRNLKPGEVKTIEGEHKRKDGSIFPVEIRLSLVTEIQPGLLISIVRDITERKEAETKIVQREEALASSERFLNTIIDTEPDCVKLLDSESNLLMMNRAGLAMLEADSFEQVKGQCMSSLTTSRYRDAYVALTKQVFQGIPGTLEFETIGLKGQHVWLESHAVPFRNERGEIVALLGITRNTTGQKQAKKALFESEERFRSFVENANDIVFSLTTEGVFTYVSPNWKDAFGYELAETIGKPFAPFVHPEDVHNCFAFLQLVLETGEKQRNVEYRVLHKNGTWIWYEANGSFLQNPENNEVSFLGIGRDISERRNAEESLRNSELHYRSIFDNSLIGVVVTDANFLYIDVNDSFCKMLGYERDELIGKKGISDLTHPEDVAISIEMMSRLKRNEINELVLEKRYISKSGEIITGLAYARGNYKADGEYIGASGSILDITGRKKAEIEKLQLERQLLHAQKLESLGIMAGGIAHDFNNLLQSILGNMELALRNLNTGSEPQKLIASAMKSCKHAAHLTGLILDYSGRGFVFKKELDLNELVKENAGMLRTAASASISTEIYLSEELPVIMAEEASIQQVVMNLIINAAESIEGNHGLINITTGIQSCDQSYLTSSLLVDKPEPGRFVFLEVKDNGCGMSEETVKRLFDPFFSTKLTGRGLGMSAVMGIMKSHGGALFVESEVSKGTTFRVLFPVTESAGPAATQPHPDPDRLPEGEGILREGTKSSPERCDIQEVQFSGLALLVDDEKNVLKTCTKMVKLCGFEVITACDGFDAVAKFREHANEIDVVLMDLTMPNMGGIEAMGEIYSTRRDARVILSSGFNKEELSGRIAGQPPSGFIRKPYSMGELEAELLRVMQGVLITTTGEQHNGDDR